MFRDRTDAPWRPCIRRNGGSRCREDLRDGPSLDSRHIDGRTALLGTIRDLVRLRADRGEAHATCMCALLVLKSSWYVCEQIWGDAHATCMCTLLVLKSSFLACTHICACVAKAQGCRHLIACLCINLMCIT